MRWSRLLPFALPALAGSCIVHDTSPSQQTTLFVFANFANPNVTVKINGQTLGQLTRQYSGGIDCASFGAVVTAGTMLRTTLQLGQTYDIEWSYGDGRSDSDELAVTSDVIASPCPFEEIGAPAGVPSRP
jgi:hypothetical protein